MPLISLLSPITLFVPDNAFCPAKFVAVKTKMASNRSIVDVILQNKRFKIKKYRTFFRVDMQLYQNEWKLKKREIVWKHDARIFL